MTTQALADTIIALVEASGLDAKGRSELLILITPKLLGLNITPTRTVVAPPPAAVSALQPGGAVWIAEGNQCKCKACKKPVYTVTKNVYETTTLELLQEAFSPIGDAPVFPEGATLFGDPYGNLAIDCPLCKGVKTLWIRGEGEYEGETPSGV